MTNIQDTTMQSNLNEGVANPPRDQVIESALIEDTLSGTDNRNGATASHVKRTISLTEQRLRANNEPAWFTTAAGWSRFLHLLSSGRKR
ncbi:MAG TPA: hypothetical protein VIF83_05925 [Gemmatimonadaceae bacterium]